MTPDEQTAMRALSDACLRRNFDLCEAQIRMAHEQGNTEALTKLQEWSDAYLTEKVRRGIR